MSMYDLKETIEMAAAQVGSQRALAKLLGEQDSTISAFKNGRACSYQKHAQIAAAAGLQDRAVRILLEGMASTLSDDLAHEAQAKAGMLAMLSAFPPEEAPTSESEEMKVNSSSRHRWRLLIQILAQYRHLAGIFFARRLVCDASHNDHGHVEMACCR